MHRKPGPRRGDGAPRMSFWLATDEGLACLSGDDGQAPLEELSKREERYWETYLELFRFIGSNGGCTQVEVTRHLASWTPFGELHREVSVAHLLDQAQKAGGIGWEDGWRLRPEGQALLA